MKFKGLIRFIVVLIIVMANIGCDQISKTIVRKEIAYNESVSLIDKYLTLTRVENFGAFMSAGSSLPYYIRFILLSLLPLIFLSYGLYLILTRTNLSKVQVTGWCFVIGGGLGNLYDRIIHGSVTDFLHLDLIMLQTGVFNMADVSIMTGTFIILINIYMNRHWQVVGFNL